jgi:hypothetical protein
MILGALVALYVVVSAALAIKRRRIARWLASQPEEIQRQLREEHLEYRFARVPNESNVGFSARTAVRIGCLWVNVPIVPLLIAPLAVAQAIEPSGRSILGALLLVLGFVLAWVWWSVNVTLWRRWASRRGVDADELQWRGEEASLLWPRGHWFERTEFGGLFGPKRSRHDVA